LDSEQNRARLRGQKLAELSVLKKRQLEENVGTMRRLVWVGESYKDFVYVPSIELRTRCTVWDGAGMSPRPTRIGTPHVESRCVCAWSESSRKWPCIRCCAGRNLLRCVRGCLLLTRSRPTVRARAVENRLSGNRRGDHRVSAHQSVERRLTAAESNAFPRTRRAVFLVGGIRWPAGSFNRPGAPHD
jgi:hypothetical protein